LRNRIDLTSIFDFSDLLFLLLLLSLFNGHLVDFSTDSVPEVLKPKTEEFITNDGWSIYSTNLSRLPGEWINPFGQQLVVVITCSFNYLLNWSVASLICRGNNKNNRIETCSNNHTILNNSISISCCFKNWSTEIKSSSGKLLSLFSLDLINRHWLICRWSDLIVNNN